MESLLDERNAMDAEQGTLGWKVGSKEIVAANDHDAQCAGIVQDVVENVLKVGQLERFALGQLHTKVVLQAIRQDGENGIKWVEAVPFHHGPQNAVHWRVIQPLLQCKQNLTMFRIRLSTPSSPSNVFDTLHQLPVLILQACPTFHVALR